MKEIIKLGLILFLIGSICAGLLSIANGITAPTIAAQTEKSKQEAMKVLFPEAEGFKQIEKVESDLIGELYVAYKGSEYLGSVAKAMPPGYAGEIALFVGVDGEGKVSGIQIISHSETPGLGANATADTFKDQFKGKSGTLEVVKGEAKESEISAITGATITTKAVTDGVNTVLAYIASYQEALIKEVIQ